MEKTFQDPVIKSDAERQQENAKRAEKGEPQIPGAAGRESIPNKDPKGKQCPTTNLSPSANMSFTAKQSMPDHLFIHSSFGNAKEFDVRGGPGSEGPAPVQEPTI